MSVRTAGEALELFGHLRPAQSPRYIDFMSATKLTEKYVSSEVRFRLCPEVGPSAWRDVKWNKVQFHRDGGDRR